MMYASYDYYVSTFLGSAITEEDFSRLALRASRFLDYYTMNRARKNADNEAVKMACCAVVEAYQSVERAESKRGIASESVGSYSVSYTGDENVKTALANAARQYLAFTGLLYRGRC